VWNGVLRGFQIYNARLTLNEVAQEIASPLSSSRAGNIWYLNINPTPGDISDKSGKGHHPSWVGNERPSLWGQATTPPAPPAAPTNIRIIR
jgi:hypothetical protein